MEGGGQEQNSGVLTRRLGFSPLRHLPSLRCTWNSVPRSPQIHIRPEPQNLT